VKDLKKAGKQTALNAASASKKCFVTLFSPCENIHLAKDIGKIPYVLHRDFGWDSYVLCTRNGSYPDLETEVPDLKLWFIEKSSHYHIREPILYNLGAAIRAMGFWIPFLLRYGKKIDVLQFYGLTNGNLIIGTLYKIINRRGIGCLRLDFNPDIAKFLSLKLKARRAAGVRDFLARIICRLTFDIFTVENKSLLGFLRTEHPRLKAVADRIYYLPNGVDVDKLSSLTADINKIEKENLMLHVGMIGRYQKGSEIIIESFAKVAQAFPEWKLVLTGKMESQFKDYFREFLEKHEDIRERMLYLGLLEREKLYDYYKKSKILAIPSRWEVFSLASVEAAYFGNVILGSDIPGLRELTNNGKLGYLCTIDDVECFVKTLRYLLSHDEEVRAKSKLIREFVIDNYDWHKICHSLHDIILAHAKGF
jgi:glycosyltransferase involved in cell wall biosynthesis